MKKFFFIFNFFIANVSFVKSQVNASFTAPDTVCVNTQFTIQNTTTGGGSSYYWNFCSGNVNTTPQAVNLGNIGQFNGPVFSCITFDGNYHVFVDNNTNGTLSRLDYGNSLLNTPTSVNLGSLGGILPGNLEDIHIEKENGNWYGIVVGGYSGYEQILRIDFGNSLTNPNPVATSYGNIGGLSYPQRLQIFTSGGNKYGFVTNRNGDTFTRFDFGNSIANTPIGTNLGNIGQLNIPDAISIINYANNWYGFIINEGSNSVTRLDFGSSLLNTPTGTNLGLSNVLNGPRGLNIFTDCNNISGLITNRFSNDLVILNFPGGPTGPIVFNSVGNIANFSFPHSIERFRVGDTLYAFIPNVSNNTMSRVFWPGCTNASISSSTLQTPPAISYNAPGTYNISLVVDETLLTASSFCKEVVVVGPPTATITANSTFCENDTIKLQGAPPGCTYQWAGPNNFSSTNNDILIPPNSGNVSGTYSLVVSKNGCAGPQVTQAISVVSSPTVHLGNDTSFCASYFAMILDAANPGSNYVWNTGQTSQSITVNSAGTYSVLVTNNTGCKDSGSITINNTASIAVDLGNDTLICQGSTLILNAGNAGSSYQWSNGATTQAISVNSPGTYFVYVSNNSGCFGQDTISITNYNPIVNIGNDTTFCSGHALTLDAKNPGSNFNWSTGATTQTISVNSSGTYSIVVSLGNCYYSDAINVTVNPTPTVNLGNSVSICNGSELTLNAGNSGATYLWSNGATTQTISVNTAGVFSVMVTNAYNCSVSGSQIISLYNLPVNLGKDTSICQGSTLVLNAGNPGSNYLWNTNETTQTIKIYNAGTYWVKVNQGTCYNYDTIIVKEDIRPIVNIGKDTVMCPGDDIKLSVDTLYNSYHWSNGNTMPSIVIHNPGTYSVTVTNGTCKVTDTIFIDECEGEIWVPNCFTPNEDYHNNYFSPVYSNIDNLTILIFDRWGQEIFKGTGDNIAWDGKYQGMPCAQGIYCYIINYEKPGKYIEKKRLSGYFTLIR